MGATLCDEAADIQVVCYGNKHLHKATQTNCASQFCLKKKLVCRSCAYVSRGYGGRLICHDCFVDEKQGTPATRRHSLKELRIPQELPDQLVEPTPSELSDHGKHVEAESLS